MVKSKIESTVDYSENRDVDSDDFEHPSARYNYAHNGVKIVIVLGAVRHTYSRYNIVYYPIYLVFGDEVDSKIGIFEVESSRSLEIIDADGDLDLKQGNIILFDGINGEQLKNR